MRVPTSSRAAAPGESRGSTVFVSFSAEFFFEWGPLTKEEEKKKLSKPWAISLAGDGLFDFGGIRDIWKGQDQSKNEFIVESFSIITTDPNEVLEPFHNRCPSSSNRRTMSDGSRRPNPPSESMKAWRVANLQGDCPHLLDLRQPHRTRRKHSRWATRFKMPFRSAMITDESAARCHPLLDPFSPSHHQWTA